MACAKFSPAVDRDIEKVFDFPFLVDCDTVNYLRKHGRIFFLIRGPPGTRKHYLGNLLTRTYPGAKMYCADSLFSTPCAPEWTPENLAKSHQICYQKTENFMKENAAVVINRNSNVQPREVVEFFPFAAKYGYTVIIVETPQKFSLDPEVLAVSNSKKLDKNYFESRLKNWGDVFPLYMGWFLSPSDAVLLTEEFKIIRKAVDQYGAGHVPDIVPFPSTMFCVAEFCNFDKSSSGKSYCSSSKVRNALGCFSTLIIFGYAIIKDFIVALVSLTSHQRNLLGKNQFSDFELADGFDSFMITKDWKPELCYLSPSDAQLHSVPTLSKTGNKAALPDKNSVSFILLGSLKATEDLLSQRKLKNVWQTLIREFEIVGGEVKAKEIFSDKVIAYKSENSWLFINKEGIQVDSIFTGFYQKYQDERPQCKFFQKGYCRNGSNCGFKHSKRSANFCWRTGKPLE